jgi:septal ring factor EnvC (AmiA/AmiB activator)
LGSAKRNSNRESLDPREIERAGSANSGQVRKSASHTSLPSPPPAIPLPPLPGSPPPAQTTFNVNSAPSPPTSRHQSKDIAQAQLVEDQEARIRTIEKHLFAEKQLTATLEEALTDLEASSTKVKAEMESWKKKCTGLEEELGVMRKERSLARHSLQAVEEERNARMRVEAERAHLEARMAALNNAKGSKKKKSTLNCF